MGLKILDCGGKMIHSIFSRVTSIKILEEKKKGIYQKIEVSGKHFCILPFKNIFYRDCSNMLSYRRDHKYWDHYDENMRLLEFYENHVLWEYYTELENNKKMEIASNVWNSDDSNQI